MPSEEHDSVVAMLRAVGLADDVSTPVDSQRLAYDALGAAIPLPDGVDVASTLIGGVPCEWVTAPEVENTQTLIYLHGGGYSIGSCVSHREFAARLSAASRMRVAVVDYRRAPETPFPGALDDALSVYRTLLDGGAEPERIALGGDSAGGGLALAGLVALRDAGDPLPAAAAVISPWVDLTLSGETMDTKAGVDPVVSRAALEIMAAAYLDDADPKDPGASPLYGDLGGLPPVFIVVGTAEVLLDDARRMAAALRDAGNTVVLEEYEDLIHIFPQICPLSPEAAGATSAIGAFLAANTR